MRGTLLLQQRWVRGFIIAGIALASFVAALAIAYELALARVPRHRAALESLVRSQTGLDIRFNELSLRWGWYGPEAVFRRVELGEPGRSNVLLRAPQLAVGIDAWRTARSGQLVAGRITFIAPDIDLERLTRPPPGEAADVDPPSPGRRGSPVSGPPSSRARVLDRWKGGVIDIQGGSLRLPDPSGGSSALTLQIRRAALRRADNEWSGHALVFLPERLGRTARVVAQLTGDINQPSTFSGALRFEGVNLAFASWRGVLAELPRVARNLPLSGVGDVTFDLALKSGRVEKADGQIRAGEVVLSAASWGGTSSGERGSTSLSYLSGDWRFLRRGDTSQLQVEQLVLDRDQRDSALPRFTVEMAPGRVRTTLEAAPMRSLAVVAHWLLPEIAPLGVGFDGTAENIDIDWNAARPEGHRLAASARVDAAVATHASRRFTLKDVPVRMQASEKRLGIEIDAPAARLELASDPQSPLESLRLVARADITRAGEGWKITLPRFTFSEQSITGEITGTVTADTPDAVPMLDLRGTVARADVARVQQALVDAMPQAFGNWGTRVGAGRIEEAAFELRGRADASTPSFFAGSLLLREATIPADGAWPEVKGLDARVQWNDSRVRASISKGTASSFDLESVEAQWDAAGERPSSLEGRAHGRLEDALAWLRANPELIEYAPHLQDLVARGDVLFNFDVDVPAATAVTPPASPRTRARVTTVLEGVQFTLAPDLPPVESLRGALAYDTGRLQRSTLSATWLGGPLTLRLGERRDRSGSSLTVQAQGFVDARKLVALSQIRHLAEVRGETAWSGEFVYTPRSTTLPARWQGRADSNLIGVTSELPAPLAKVDSASLPLHLEISGADDRSELRANLADRVRTAFQLRVVERQDWQIERGAIRLGGGAASLPADDLILVRGRVSELDLPGYALAWQQLRKGASDTRTDVDISADEILIGDRVYEDGSVEITANAGAAALRISAPALGNLTGTLRSNARELIASNLRLERDSLAGTGSIRCATDLSTCRSEFDLKSTDAAAALASFGFRPDVSAAKGALSGEIAWQPRHESSWLQSATGTLKMRFDDGIARHPTEAAGRPFALLTVPALLSGVGRPPSQPGLQPASQPGELRFDRLEASFQLRDGQATTADLHFDGDAEILVRGRVGLLTRDYDHEAWVLRGEDRIPTSVRRLASAPRVAAAWLSLRELMGSDAASRSRIVLRLRGSWNEPVVTVE